jgi:hypothetical protein
MLDSLSENVVVETLLLAEPLTEDEIVIVQKLQETAEAVGITVRYYRRGEDDIVFGEAVLSVMPYDTISRSVQPVLGWSLSAHGEDLLYLGGAAFETSTDSDFSLQRDSRLADSELLLLGIHGPLYKESLPSLSDKSGNLYAVAAANEEVRAWLGDSADGIAVYTARSGGLIKMILG